MKSLLSVFYPYIKYSVREMKKMILNKLFKEALTNNTFFGAFLPA